MNYLSPLYDYCLSTPRREQVFNPDEEKSTGGYILPGVLAMGKHEALELPRTNFLVEKVPAYVLGKMARLFLANATGLLVAGCWETSAKTMNWSLGFLELWVWGKASSLSVRVLVARPLKGRTSRFSPFRSRSFLPRTIASHSSHFAA